MSQKENVIDKTRKFFGVLSGYVDKMPRNKKFTIGDRLLNNNLELLELLVEAYYGDVKTKLNNIRKGNIKLEILRQLLRLQLESNQHNLKKHEYFSREIDNIGTDLGGWSKQLQTRSRS